MSRQLTLKSEVSSTSEEGKILHLAVIGDSGVGKSTVIARLFKHWTELNNRVQKKGGKEADDLGIKGLDLTVDIVDTSTKMHSFFTKRLPSCDVYVLVYSLVRDDSFESVVKARDQVLRLKGPSVPIVFVANKTDIADSVDKTERVYRDLNISCEWDNGHEEISAEKDTSIIQVLEQIMKRHHKYVSATGKKENFFSMKNLFSRIKRN